jgi:hypothetical protein
MAQLTGNKIKDTYLGLLKTNGSGILTSGFQRITDGSGLGSQLYLSLTQIKFYDAYIFPDADGSANQVLKTDGAGVLTWENDSLSNTLNFSGGTGTGLVTLDTQVLAFTGTANEIETSASSQAITLSFPTAGVTLPNGSIATTQTASDNSTKVATTAYVDAALTLKLDLAGGTMSGDIAMGANNLSGAGTVSATTFLGDLNGTINTATTATTQSAGDNSTKVATTAYVDNQVSTAGTVTSVALSVPTGLTVTGSPITTSGTIAIANTSGYSIPTDAKQTQWDTAYTNRITTATSPLSITTNTISLNTVPVSNGGTGATTLTGILLGNGTSAISSITSANDGYILTADGVGGYAFEVASGGDVNVSGTPVANQIAIWTDATTIKGDPTFIIDSNHKITLYQPNSVPTSLLNYNIGGGNIANTTGSINTGFGYNNLNSVTSGYANNAFGSEALLSLSTGYNNVAIGLTAGKLITAATDNVFIGGSSARNKITGNFNIAIGASAYSGNSGGPNLNSGNYNVIIGSSAMITAVGSNNNVVIGHESSYNNANSENNTAVGFQSLYTSATNNGNNTAIGFKSLYLSTGERNLAIGSLAGSAITTGNKNVIIGSNTGSTIDGLSNRIIISDGDGNIRQYIDDVGNVGIGTDDPSLYPLAPQLVVDTGTSGGGITIKSGSSNYGGVYFADGSAGNEQYRGYIQYSHNFAGIVDGMLFGTEGTTKLAITSGGTVQLGDNAALVWGSNSATDPYIQAGSSGDELFFGRANAFRMAIRSDNVVDFTAGIRFTNQSASTGTVVASSVLDGYEEGTFTVTLNSSDGNATVTSANDEGLYVRVGNQVSVQFYSDAITVTTLGTGVAKISGLPYQSASTDYHVLTLTHVDCFASLVQNGYVSPGAADFYPILSNSTSIAAWKNASSTYFMLGGTYLI